MAGVSRHGDLQRRGATRGRVHGEGEVEERAPAQEIQEPRRCAAPVPAVRRESSLVSYMFFCQRLLGTPQHFGRTTL